MFCPQCRHLIDDDATVCPWCGIPLGQAPSEVSGSRRGSGNMAARVGNIIIVIMLSAAVVALLCLPSVASPYLRDLRTTANQMSSDANGVINLLGVDYALPTIATSDDLTYTTFAVGDALDRFTTDISSVSSWLSSILVSLGISSITVPDLSAQLHAAKIAQRVFLILWIVCIGLLVAGVAATLITKGRSTGLSVFAFSVTLLVMLAWWGGLTLANSMAAQQMSTYLAQGSAALGNLGYSTIADQLMALLPTSAYLETLLWPKVAAATCTIALVALVAMRAASKHGNRDAIADTPQTV